jgi:hypothetical protein
MQCLNNRVQEILTICGVMFLKKPVNGKAVMLEVKGLQGKWSYGNQRHMKHVTKSGGGDIC